MKKISLIVALIVCQIAIVNATNYYLDSSLGSDSNSGVTIDAPWKSLEKINSITFKPGDVIHFVNGGEWKGYFEPKGSGVDGKPIVVKSYGEGTDRPKIDGEGRVGKGVVYLYNQSHWEISDLELTNDAKEAGDRRGVWVVADKGAGVLSHIHLKNLHIHNIKGIIGQGRKEKRTSGIAFTTFDDTSECRFDDIWIDGCVINDCDNQGIITEYSGGGFAPQSERWIKTKITNARITNNLIFNISKNAMILRLFDGGVVEYNTCYNTAIGSGDGMSGNTIFTASCDGTLFQFNEGYENRSPEADGSLYDADLRSPNTVWQYSLSHNNAHGLFWGCTTAEDVGVVCRYNVSNNDKGIIFCVNYPVAEMIIYNNTVIIGKNTTPKIISERGVGGDEPRNYSFKNNLIYGGDGFTTYQFAKKYYTRDIENNHYYSGLYKARPDRHAEFGDVMKSPKDFEGEVLFNEMNGVGAFSQGDKLPEPFVVMDFMNNFKMKGEHIKVGEKLVVKSDYKSKKTKQIQIQIKVYDPNGKAIYDQKRKLAGKYSLGAICSERGVYKVEFKVGERTIRKNLWVI